MASRVSGAQILAEHRENFYKYDVLCIKPCHVHLYWTPTLNS